MLASVLACQAGPGPEEALPGLLAAPFAAVPGFSAGVGVVILEEASLMVWPAALTLCFLTSFNSTCISCSVAGGSTLRWT